MLNQVHTCLTRPNPARIFKAKLYMSHWKMALNDPGVGTNGAETHVSTESSQACQPCIRDDLCLPKLNID